MQLSRLVCSLAADLGRPSAAATNQGVYAPASRRVFVSCMRRPDPNGGVVTGGTDPGIVEISTDTDEPVDAWPHVLVSGSMLPSGLPSHALGEPHSGTRLCAPALRTCCT